MTKKFFTICLFVSLLLGVGYWYFMHKQMVLTCNTLTTNDVHAFYDCEHLSFNDFSIQQHYDLFYRNAQFYSDFNKSSFIFDFISFYNNCANSDSCQIHDKNRFLNVMEQCALEEDNTCMDIYLSNQKLPTAIPDKILITLNIILNSKIQQNSNFSCSNYSTLINTLSEKQKKYFTKTVLDKCSSV
jgi:hypothetical protein